MKNIKKIKECIARVLAVAMVLTMVAVPDVAHAIDLGAETVIKFDPGVGPDLSHSDIEAYTKLASDSNGVTMLHGLVGYPLKDATESNGIPTETDKGASGERPVQPTFPSGIWQGYTFDGWYDSNDKKISYLPYAFPYNDETVYEAKWIGDDTCKFNFTVMHYRDLNSTRASITDGTNTNAWPSDTATDLYRFFNDGSWTTQVTADTPISATYKRTIPGYKVDSVIIKNNNKRRYNETSDTASLGETAYIKDTTNAVAGYMPNDNLTVAYRYVPDTTKKFSIRVEYVDENGSSISPADTYSYSAEERFEINPKPIDSYSLISASQKPGKGDIDDLEGSGEYSAQTAGCAFDTDKKYSGRMPNQPITIVYTYKALVSFEAQVSVVQVDDNDEALDTVKVATYSTAATCSTAMPKREGYDYPPNVWATDGNFVFVDRNETDQKFYFKVNSKGGKIVMTYLPTVNDKDYWIMTSYANSENGSLIGDSNRRQFKPDTYDIGKLTEGIVPTADTNYRFNGWYKADSAGRKTGSILSGDVTLKKQENVTLYAEFVEEEGKWFDVSFESGSHGSLSHTNGVHVAKDTAFSDLELPDPAPDDGYIFDGWYDESDHKVNLSSTTILADQTYTAKFVSRTGEDGTLCMPDGTGSVRSKDGLGIIKINGANESRRYAITDEDGVVLATDKGSKLIKESFEGFDPCDSYYAYELSYNASPVVGKLITETVDENLRSQPSRVVIEALGDNYSIADDGSAKKIVISPAADDNVYAILDVYDNLIDQPGSTDGWVAAVDGKVELTGLDSNAFYHVVAKKVADNDSPIDKLYYSSQVLVKDSSDADREFTFATQNGGYIDAVTRNGVALDVEEGATEALVKKGDIIEISADETNSSGAAFDSWEVSIGNVAISYPEKNNQKLEMTAGDVIMQALYENTSKVSVDYSPKDGKLAIDKTDDITSELKEELTNNTDDKNAINEGKSIAYTIKFDTHAPTASVSDAVKESADDSSRIKIPWSVDIGLSRKVDDVNKALPAGGNQDVLVSMLGKIDTSLLDNIDYKLLRVIKDDGSIGFEELTMLPDPNDYSGDTEFTGSFSFEANIGDTLVFTYYKANKVTIIDTKREQTHEIKVRDGSCLDDSAEYMDLDIHESYIDEETGIAYELKCLSKNEAGSTEFDTSSDITKDMTLYAIYEQEDDSEWQKAKKQLQDEIDKANELKNNSKVSSEDKEALEEEIKKAVDLVNQLPRPTIDELVNEYEVLKKLVDEISKKGSDGGGSGGGDSGGGGSGGGGGGGGGGGSVVSGGGSTSSGPGSSFKNSYRTYVDGTDGSWNIIDAANHKWVFTLNNGGNLTDTWANVKYSYNGSTKTATYHFGSDGVMNSGWFCDQTTNKWYFLSDVHDGWFGKLTDGWHLDANDGRWYYLSSVDGSMLLGWQEIDGKWYYLAPNGDKSTWRLNSATNRMEYTSTSTIPLGSLYTNAVTPDGYSVDANGVCVK